MICKPVSWLALAAVAVSFAAPSAAAPPGPATPAAKALPRAEFLIQMDAEFRKIDANKDGVITREEVEAFQRSTALASADERARSLFATLDTDKNGQLSLTEFARLASGQPSQINGQPFIAQMDTSHDGKVSLVEHRTATLANFDRMDTDKDGIVTPAEMKAAGIVR